MQLAAFSRLPDGGFQFTLTGSAGSHAVIEFSGDAVHWQELGSATITSSGFVFVDPEAGTQSQRFYRARFAP
jgi:hypothetical protein